MRGAALVTRESMEEVVSETSRVQVVIGAAAVVLAAVITGYFQYITGRNANETARELSMQSVHEPPDAGEESRPAELQPRRSSVDPRLGDAGAIDASVDLSRMEELDPETAVDAAPAYATPVDNYESSAEQDRSSQGDAAGDSPPTPRESSLDRIEVAAPDDDSSSSNPTPPDSVSIREAIVKSKVWTGTGIVCNQEVDVTIEFLNVGKKGVNKGSIRLSGLSDFLFKFEGPFETRKASWGIKTQRKERVREAFGVTGVTAACSLVQDETGIRIEANVRAGGVDLGSFQVSP